MKLGSAFLLLSDGGTGFCMPPSSCGHPFVWSQNYEDRFWGRASTRFLRPSFQFSLWFPHVLIWIFTVRSLYLLNLLKHAGVHVLHTHIHMHHLNFFTWTVGCKLAAANWKSANPSTQRISAASASTSCCFPKAPPGFFSFLKPQHRQYIFPWTQEHIIARCRNANQSPTRELII